MKLILPVIIFVTIFSHAFAKVEKKEVFVQKMEKQLIEISSLYPGEVKSRVYSTVKSQIDGIVESIDIKLGEEIERGKKLLGLANQDSTLNFKNHFSEAPVSGFVSEIYVRKGNYVSKGQDLLLITNPDKIFVNVEIPAKDFPKVKIGTKAKLYADALDKPVTLTLAGKGYVTNKVTGTVTCEFEFEKKTQLLAGMLGRVEVNFDSSSEFIVDDSSLLYIGDKTYIRKVEKGKAKKIEVTTGNKINGKIIIKEGLTEGDTIVTRSNGFIVDGDDVKVVQ